MHWAGRLLLLAVLAAACTGCGPPVDYHRDPTVKTLKSSEKAMLWESTWNTVQVVSVDGKAMPKFGTFREQSIPFSGRRFWLRPGIHQVEVRYNDGYKYSLHTAELSFVVEGGHRYEVEQWPPKVKDVTTKQWVPNQVRVAD